MSQHDRLPELKQILGAMIFGADRPISAAEMRRCLQEVAEKDVGEAKVFGEVSKKDVADALAALASELAQMRTGFGLGEISGDYRLHSEPACGRWLKHLLKMERPHRLSRPALETLAIIAYRQPVSKAQIEGIRGVGVDHLIKALMELQLVRITGRSELPGRPLLYGTTQLFLEHFGLKGLDQLADVEPLLALQREQEARSRKAAISAARSAAGKPAAEAAAAVPPEEPVFESDASDEPAAADEAPVGEIGEASDPEPGAVAEAGEPSAEDPSQEA
jgi:segregation and condensation protein B